MTTRRHFIAGLLATAAAPACPAQPAPFSPVSDPRLMVALDQSSYIWFHSGPQMVLWSDDQDMTPWGKT